MMWRWWSFWADFAKVWCFSFTLCCIVQFYSPVYCTSLILLRIIIVVFCRKNIARETMWYGVCELRHLLRLRYRENFQRVLVEKQIDIRLVLNYDQTWMCAYRCPKTMLKKKTTKRSCLNIARTTGVVGARAGLSVCTSSWANGDPGPLFLSCSSNSLSDAFISEMNESLGMSKMVL